MTPEPIYKNSFLSLFNSDCMPIMKQFRDNEFDLAIVDVPYGIGEDGSKNIKRIAKTKYGGKFSNTGSNIPPRDYKPYSGNDLSAPEAEYWNELRRISKNQIVWGANHFISKLPIDSSCWIVWDKDNGSNDFADCELAWTSFDTAVRRFKWRWNGMLQGDMRNKQNRIHPNEKPVQLYEWCLLNYAKPGFKILDTHFGSGSHGIAVDKLNKYNKMDLKLTAIELDSFYANKSVKRIELLTSQNVLSF